MSLQGLEPCVTFLYNAGIIMQPHTPTGMLSGLLSDRLVLTLPKEAGHE
jgi:hypothetical protein